MGIGRTTAYSCKRTKIKRIGVKALTVYVAVVMVVTLSPWQNMQAGAESNASTNAATATQADATATTTDKSAPATTKSQPAATDAGAAAIDAGAATTDGSAAAGDSAAPSTAPFIAPQSSAEQDGQYSITIDYVDQTGTKLQPSWQGLAANGAAWSQKSPDIENYELVDSAQATVSGTASGSDHFLTYTVTYKPIVASYTVIHQKQLSSGAYYTVDTETLTADAGTAVTAVPKTYAGYRCVTSNRTLVVKVDGTASITLEYGLDNPAPYSIYFYTQSTPIDPINVAVGAAVTAPADPTRTGYTFAGWDTNGDGAVDALPTTMPDHNVYATAVWVPATVNYVINYYQQNTDGTTYALAETTTATGITGTTTPTAPAKGTSTETSEYAWFEYSHETPVTINADGSSILDVYYDRVTVTIAEYIEVGSSQILYDDTQAALYGTTKSLPDQQAVMAAYNAAGGTSTYFSGWVNPKKNALVAAFLTTSAYTDFATKTVTYVAKFSNDPIYSYYTCSIRENLDGTYSISTVSAPYTTTHDGTWEVQAIPRGFSLVAARPSTNVYYGGDASAITWADTWKTNKDYQGTYILIHLMGASYNVAEFKYTRNSYNATYYSNGSQVAQVSHLYEAPYTTTTDCVGTTLTPPSAGYAFDGWYTNDQYTGSAITDTTMAYQGSTYYAKWSPIPVTVTFNSAGGSAVASETGAKGSAIKKPADPTRAGFAFEGWYYRGPDGTATPVYFEFDQPVESDITLYAMWTQLPPIATADYTVIHETTDGTVLATEQGNGAVGEAVGASALAVSDPLRQGYSYVDAQNKSLILQSEAAVNVITFVYSDDPVYTYTVHYVEQDTGKRVAADKAISSGINLVDVIAMDIDGYTLVGDSEGYVSALSPDYTFYYTKNATNVTTIEDGKTPQGQALPKTDDPMGLVVLGALAALGGAGIWMALHRRREEDGR